MDPLLDDLLEVLRLLQSMEGPKYFPNYVLVGLLRFLNPSQYRLKTSTQQCSTTTRCTPSTRSSPPCRGRSTTVTETRPSGSYRPALISFRTRFLLPCTHLSNEQCCLSFVSLIDREGRSLVKCSSYQACNEVNRHFKVHFVNNFMDVVLNSLQTDLEH